MDLMLTFVVQGDGLYEIVNRTRQMLYLYIASNLSVDSVKKVTILKPDFIIWAMEPCCGPLRPLPLHRHIGP